MKARLFLLLVMLAAGCQRLAETSTTPSNPAFQVERLFTHEGCTVYRFHDYGNARYYAACGRPGEVFWQERCGKHCQRSMGVPSS